MNARRPRIAVVHNAPVLAPDHPDFASEADVVDVARAVASALESREFETSIIAAGPRLGAFVDRLTSERIDAVFNLVEGFAGLSQGATYVTGLYELVRFPYTGCTVEALALCQSKARAKALLRGCGLPTAEARHVLPGEPIGPPPGAGPWLVKPDEEDGSLGIDQDSVVSDPAAIAPLVERLRGQYAGAVLVEEYLPGLEFNVGVVETPERRALPVAQVDYHDRPGKWPILTYAAKWQPGSEEDRASQILCPAPIEAPLCGRLQELACAAFEATGCRDYARIDVRLDARGMPMILEVNPNPDIGPGAGLARAAGFAGMEYADLVAGIARRALAREAWR